MLAKTTEDEPVNLSHASGASMSASTVPPVWPSLFIPHNSEKSGSSGIAVTCIW